MGRLTWTRGSKSGNVRPDRPTLGSEDRPVQVSSVPFASMVVISVMDYQHFVAQLFLFFFFGWVSSRDSEIMSG